MLELLVERQVYLVWQKEIIQRFCNRAKLRKPKALPKQGEVNVGAGLVVALGARAVEHRPLDLWELGKNPANARNGSMGQAVTQVSAPS